MNSENAFKQLGQKLMNGEITPEEHVKEYNRLLKEMSEKYDSQWRPHELFNINHGNTNIFDCLPVSIFGGLCRCNRWRWRIDSLPAYMFAGVPVHNAIATNKLSSCTGTVVSTWRLIKNKRVDWYFVPGTVVCALAGSVIGANLALIISDEILKTVLVVLLPIVAFCVLRDKNLEVIVPEGMTRRKQYIIAAACSLGIGIYDGFYGPGTGTFLLLAFTKLAKMDLEKSTGNVKAVNLASNISALITFILAGKILWTLGLAASCFSIAGHYTGAGMVMHNGVKIIKPIILVVLVLLLIKVISGM